MKGCRCLLLCVFFFIHLEIDPLVGVSMSICYVMMRIAIDVIWEMLMHIETRLCV